MLKAGAGIGTMVAHVSAWSLIAVARISFLLNLPDIKTAL